MVVGGALPHGALRSATVPARLLLRAKTTHQPWWAAASAIGSANSAIVVRAENSLIFTRLLLGWQRRILPSGDSLLRRHLGRTAKPAIATQGLGLTHLGAPPWTRRTIRGHSRSHVANTRRTVRTGILEPSRAEIAGGRSRRMPRLLPLAQRRMVMVLVEARVLAPEVSITFSNAV
jgi:hypothetical protein